jgi:hypothetical protein
MSYVNQYREQAWEMAYWWFANQNYLNDECEKLAGEFVEYAIENASEEGGHLESLFDNFVADVVFAEKAAADKERSLYV